MTKGVFRSLNGRLVPMDHDARTICEKNAGKEVMVSVSRPRNLQHHKKFFALLNLLWETTPCGEQYPSRDALRHALTMEAGFFEVIPTRHGPRAIPKSISFENMDQDEFSRLYDASVRLVLERILPDMTEEDLAQELLEFAA